MLVEYDATSIWYTASLTILAGWLKEGGSAGYCVYTQPPDRLRSMLQRLGLNVDDLERNERLEIYDYYTATLGHKSKEKYAIDSLKVQDLSIWFTKELLSGPPIPNWIRVVDNMAALARFNSEKAYVEFVLSRVVPSGALIQLTSIHGVTRGIHSDWAYKQFEAAVDGVIDIKVEEGHEGPRNIIRVRNLRDIDFDANWHTLKTGKNHELTLGEIGLNDRAH